MFCVKKFLQFFIGNEVKDNTTIVSGIGYECPFTEDFLDAHNQDEGPLKGQFDWSSTEQGIVLGAFYYGYIISMLPGIVIEPAMTQGDGGWRGDIWECPKLPFGEGGDFFPYFL